MVLLYGIAVILHCARCHPIVLVTCQSLINMNKNVFNHRYFVWRYENLMRKMYCRFTLSYWDWAMDSGHPWRGCVKDVWSPTNFGFGGNGMGPSQCVETGPFR